jgi:hypothetical protein
MPSIQPINVAGAVPIGSTTTGQPQQLNGVSLAAGQVLVVVVSENAWNTSTQVEFNSLPMSLLYAQPQVSGAPAVGVFTFSSDESIENASVVVNPLANISSAFCFIVG